MSVIVTRAGKGTTLSWVEADANFTNLNNDKLELTTPEFVKKVDKTSDIGSAILPAGTTAERDGSPQAGWTRFNSSLGKTETYDGTRWITGGGATGGGVDDVFYENAITVTTDYTITTGKNAMSAGPIEIADGITVTIPDGSTWSIV